MKVDELVALAKDTMTVRQVFAEPIEKDGITVIATAKVGGGGGGGQGKDKNGQEGEGGGFGMGAKPAGVYTIKDGKLRWVPAVDVNQVMIVVGAVTIAYLVTRARVLAPRKKR